MIRKIDLTNNEVEIVAGVYGEAGFNEEEEGNAIRGKLHSPMGIAIDSSGNIYIADSGNHRLRKVMSDGLLETIAVTGENGYNETAENNDPLSNNLNFPTDVAIGANNEIYFTDSGNNRIRKINASGEISTIAGTGNYGFTANAEDALQAELNTPVGLTLDEENNIYFSDSYNSRIAMVEAEGGSLVNIAGTKERRYAGDEGFAKFSTLYFPMGIQYQNGKLYFSDSSNNVIRFIETGKDENLGTEDDKIRLYAGYTGKILLHPGDDLLSDDDDHYTSIFDPLPGYLEGEDEGGALITSSMILLNNPTGISFDDEGTLYFFDSLNNRIRVIAGQANPENITIGSVELQKDFIYTLLRNSEDTEDDLLLRNIDYLSFSFDGINDYIGKNVVSRLLFEQSSKLNKNSHPFLNIHMTLVGKEAGEETEIKSNLKTTVSVREYDK